MPAALNRFFTSPRQTNPMSEREPTAVQNAPAQSRVHLRTLLFVATLLILSFLSEKTALSLANHNVMGSSLAASQSAEIQAMVSHAIAEHSLGNPPHEHDGSHENVCEVGTFLQLKKAFTSRPQSWLQDYVGSPVSSDEIAAAWRDLDRELNVLHRQVEAKWLVDNPSPDNFDSIALSRQLSENVLPRFSAVNALYQKNHAYMIGFLDTLRITFLLGELVALLAIFAFVFRPMDQKIHRRTRLQEEALRTFERRAFFDETTNLPNRNMAETLVSRVWENPDSESPQVAFLHLKIRPTTYLPDKSALAADLARQLLVVETADVMVSYFGALTFGIVVIGEGSHDKVPGLAKQIANLLTVPPTRKRAKQPFEMRISAALSGPQAQTAADLFDNAEKARLYSENVTDPDELVVFSNDMNQIISSNQKLIGEMELGLENGEFVCFFQPQLDIHSGHVIGLEALARWHHPDRGLLTPQSFLRLSDLSGLSERFCEVIMGNALGVIHRFRNKGIAIPTVGINFSKDQLSNNRLLEKLFWEMDRLSLRPEWVSIEVLETVLSEGDDSPVARNVRHLADQGFRIDLDDFGTGFSSITNIRHFKAHRIKIDRSFICNITTNTEQQQIVSAMIKTAHSLGVTVLAEGVEDAAATRLLMQMGCEAVQGYYFARPMPIEDLETWLASWNDRMENISHEQRVDDWTATSNLDI